MVTRSRGGSSPSGVVACSRVKPPKFGIRQHGHGNFDWKFGGGLWSAAPTSTRRVPILGAAGAENWHFGVASPMEITSLGLFRNADCTMRSGRYLVGRFLVSDRRSEFGKVFFL